MCSLDYSLVLIYIMFFMQFEFWWGGHGNSMLSLFLVYVIERIVRKIRREMGIKNLCNKAHVDERFLG